MSRSSSSGTRPTWTFTYGHVDGAGSSTGTVSGSPSWSTTRRMGRRLGRSRGRRAPGGRPRRSSGGSSRAGRAGPRRRTAAPCPRRSCSGRPRARPGRPSRCPATRGGRTRRRQADRPLGLIAVMTRSYQCSEPLSMYASKRRSWVRYWVMKSGSSRSVLSPAASGAPAPDLGGAGTSRDRCARTGCAPPGATTSRG